MEVVKVEILGGSDRASVLANTAMKRGGFRAFADRQTPAGPRRHSFADINGQRPGTAEIAV